ncbi:MAG: M20/M25/M40 family metallo-hydrolase [Nitrososphaeraceae archaeon]
MKTIIEKEVDDNINSIITDLKKLIQIPSVSAKNQSLVECAKMISELMNDYGIRSELLYLENNNSSIPPIIHGEVKSKKNPNGKTILFYNHYDVQPEDPIDKWDYPPFEGTVLNNCIYGRGAADDKGELITRIKAVEFFLKKTGDVPCNIKFLVEGEEEVGSKHISKYLNKYQDKFSCDGIIWEFGYIDTNNKPIISLGMKGLLYVELFSQGPVRDTHSSLAVLIENPAWKLIKLLDTIRDENGNILIKDWYKDVRSFTKDELDILKSEEFDELAFRKEYGISNFISNLSGLEAKKALVANPTCNIAGLVSGYTGNGAKTIIPSSASVKIDFRLVPNMVPEKQFQLLKRHIDSSKYNKDIQLYMIHGEAASRTSVNHPFVLLISDCAKDIFGDATLSISSAGTGPMHAFHQYLNAPAISIGSTFVYSRIHSPNEFARIDLLISMTKCVGRIIEKFND